MIDLEIPASFKFRELRNRIGFVSPNHESSIGFDFANCEIALASFREFIGEEFGFDLSDLWGVDRRCVLDCLVMPMARIDKE